MRFFTEYLGFGWGGFFSDERGNLGSEVGNKRFKIFGEVLRCVLRILRARWFPPSIPGVGPGQLVRVIQKN